jgi:hypothetical protein
VPERPDAAAVERPKRENERLWQQVAEQAKQLAEQSEVDREPGAPARPAPTEFDHDLQAALVRWVGRPAAGPGPAREESALARRAAGASGPLPPAGPRRARERDHRPSADQLPTVRARVTRATGGANRAGIKVIESPSMAAHITEYRRHRPSLCRLSHDYTGGRARRGRWPVRPAAHRPDRLSDDGLSDAEARGAAISGGRAADPHQSGEHPGGVRRSESRRGSAGHPARRRPHADRQRLRLPLREPRQTLDDEVDQDHVAAGTVDRRQCQPHA